MSDARIAIARAEVLLPGRPAAAGDIDPRWQAIIEISEHVETDPEPVWEFVARWGCHSDEDLRAAIATCLLEHLLEHHFEVFFPRVERAVLADSRFADTFRHCWRFGQSEMPANATRFEALRRRAAPDPGSHG